MANITIWPKTRLGQLCYQANDTLALLLVEPLRWHIGSNVMSREAPMVYVQAPMGIRYQSGRNASNCCSKCRWLVVHVAHESKRERSWSWFGLDSLPPHLLSGDFLFGGGGGGEEEERRTFGFERPCRSQRGNR